ncbi:hypothetical protein, partial [Undibacterium pigrum]|uniref:hypothetical protein n=1 Tax=Undibacterium pigrum TaxID=401470 RepID=UPI001B87A414
RYPIEKPDIREQLNLSRNNKNLQFLRSPYTHCNVPHVCDAHGTDISLGYAMIHTAHYNAPYLTTVA